MKSFARLMSSVLVGSALLVPPARGAEPATTGGQQAKTFETVIPVKLDYLLYVPADYGKDPAKKWPVILFLHGAGERGTDVSKVKLHGPPKLVEKEAASPAKDFIVISPQCPPEQRWRPHEVMALLDGVMKDHPQADADRVYLTGLSMGGFGTWEIAAQHGRRFAAVAPICGGGNPRFARSLRNMPVWAFHGDKDEAVPVSASIEMVDAVTKAGGTDVKLTRYPELTHDSWTVTYDNPELYAWFLAHKLPRQEARPAR
jgi:predicted peptidase